jgi:hypothetical protein
MISLMKLALVATFLSMLPAVAGAQYDLPPVRTMYTSTVDLAHQDFIYSWPVVAAGPPDPRQPQYILTYSAQARRWASNLEIYIICSCATEGAWGTVPWTGSNSDSPDDGIDLVYNGRTYQHAANAAEGVSKKIISIPGDPNGGALQFTLADGTKLNFPLSNNFCGPTCIMVNHIEFPEGQSWFFEFGPTQQPCSTPVYGCDMVGNLKSLYNAQGIGIYFASTGVGTFSKHCSTATVVCNFKPIPVVANFRGSVIEPSDDTLTDPDGVVTTLKYGPDPSRSGFYIINKVTRSDLAVPLYENTYGVGFADSGERVPALSSQKDALGQTTDYTISTWGTTVTRPNKAKERYSFLSSWNYMSLVERVDGLNRTTVMTIDSVGRQLSQTNPEGDGVIFTRDNRGNVTEKKTKPKPGPSIPVLVERWGYPACNDNNFRICNQPSYYVDARGARTDYDYSAATGQLIAKLSPPDDQGRRAITKLTYVEQAAAANISTPPGVTLRTVSRISSETTCATSPVTGTTIDFSYVCPASDATTTSYEYQASPSTAPGINMLVGVAITSASGTLRSCTRYDAEGNIIARTEPRAGRTTCNY